MDGNNNAIISWSWRQAHRPTHRVQRQTLTQRDANLEPAVSALLTPSRWVRSWILFRLAIIAQGIAARAALGQASSADARADNRAFDFFGRMAWEAKKEAEKEERVVARL